MSLLLDHDEVRKARRALILSCVVLIAADRSVLPSSEVDLLGLKLAASPEDLVLGLSAISTYLFVNWCFLQYQDWFERKQVLLESRMKSAMSEQSKGFELERAYQNGDNNEISESEISSRISDMERRLVDEMRSRVAIFSRVSDVVLVVRSVLVPASIYFLSVGYVGVLAQAWLLIVS